MNTYYKTISTLFIILFFASCSKEEPLPEREYIDTTVNAIAEPEVGGPNEPNQVYFDLRTNTATVVQRDSWDLGFYCGNDFRVIINPSIKMAVKNMETTDMNAITTVTASDQFSIVAVGTFDASNVEYVDDFDGNIQNTAIAEISDNDDENMVYLVNMGYEVGTTTPTAGSVSPYGEARGWKKIRILKRGVDYLLQYADLDDTTYQEYFIEKNTDYNFTFFSLTTESEVSVEPAKSSWDICFTVFTNEFPGYGTYPYTDFITSNYLQNVEGYKFMITTDLDYSNYSMPHLDETLLDNSQRFIGSSWRAGGGPMSSPSVYNDRIYIVKDAEGSFYKIKFTALTNTSGDRGFPKFEFQTLPLE